MGERIPARSTWRLLNALLAAANGFTKAEIARRLGLRKAELQVHTTSVTRRTALRVQQLYEDTMAEGPDTPGAAAG